MSQENNYLNLPLELLNLKQGYVYKLHFKPDDKFYIGSRQSKTFLPQDDFWVNYFTSSKVVKKLLDVYEPYESEYWDYTILEQFDTFVEAVEHENYILRNIPIHEKYKYLNVNFSAGGALIKGNSHIKLYDTEKDLYFNWPLNIEIPQNCIKKSPPTFQRTGLRSYVLIEDPSNKIWSKVDLGEKYMLSVEYTKSIKIKKNRKYYNNGIENISIDRKDTIPLGYVEGKIILPKGPQNFATTTGKRCINNGTIQKYIFPSDSMPEGFVYGAISSGMKGKTHSKETKEKMANSSKGLPGHTAWNKGLTKETSAILAEVSKKNSDYMKSNPDKCVLTPRTGFKNYYNVDTQTDGQFEVDPGDPWILGRKNSVKITPHGIFGSDQQMLIKIGVSRHIFNKNHENFPTEWYILHNTNNIYGSKTSGTKSYYNKDTAEEKKFSDHPGHPWALGTRYSAMMTPHGIFASGEEMLTNTGISKYIFDTYYTKESPSDWYYIHKQIK